MNSIKSKKNQRSKFEKIFLIFFFPSVILLYTIYKFPTLFVDESKVVETFYFFGKSTSFWYASVYTFIVCFFSLKVILKSKSPYFTKGKGKPLSNYQRSKFLSIFFVQLTFFYFLPYILPFIISGDAFFNDSYKVVNKDAYVYVYNGFTSLGGLFYIFFLVPLLAWFFGKRYCSWFCACGNLSEAIGSTVWGQKWVVNYTPRGESSKKLEWIQTAILIYAICFGLLLFLDTWQIFASDSLNTLTHNFQVLIIDFLFGAIIGIGAYPILGTRIWCRYGCPLAQLMKQFAKFSKSKSVIAANDKCKGIEMCITVCPMGIDIASFAHKDKKPILGSYGLSETPCISCGSCVDVCPTAALEFKTIFSKEK